MRVEQYVMAYSVEQDRLRAILPDGFVSLRPVLRINAEIRDGLTGYAELNTPVEKDGIRGWMNIGYWADIAFVRDNKKVTFQNRLLLIEFEGVGIEGSCPAEKDNAGCFFPDKGLFRTAEKVAVNKEFCNCSFQWMIQGGASGKSIGRTLPAYPEETEHMYPKEKLTVENAAVIPCRQVLGTYSVRFER